MLLNIVDSKRHSERVFVPRSQMIHEPSEDAETACESSFLTWMLQTRPVCSFKDASISVFCKPILQVRTSPSIPPVMMRPQSFVTPIAVTPFLCASLITYLSLPLCGRNARTLPSLQPETIDL